MSSSVLLPSCTNRQRGPTKTKKRAARYWPSTLPSIPALSRRWSRVRYAEKLTIAQMQPLIDASAKYNRFTPFPAQELLFTAR
jgi:hypothetical protein